MRTIFLYIAFSVALNIVAEPIPYTTKLAKDFEKVATTLYIPATKQAPQQGYLFSEADMNQCLAWGEETKMWRKKAIDIQNQGSDKYIIAIVFFAIGITTGGVLVWGMK